MITPEEFLMAIKSESKGIDVRIRQTIKSPGIAFRFSYNAKKGIDGSKITTFENDMQKHIVNSINTTLKEYKKSYKSKYSDKTYSVKQYMSTSLETISKRLRNLLGFEIEKELIIKEISRLIEMGVLCCDTHFINYYFDDLKKAIDFLKVKNFEEYYEIFYPFNNIDSEIRFKNHFVRTQRDEDVNKVNCLVVDLDFGKYVGDDGKTYFRTQNEINKEKDRASAIISEVLPPSIVMDTRQGLHEYWLTDDIEPKDFKTFQLRLIDKFKSLQADKQVCNLSRVLRLPGFYHLKGEPYLISCVKFEPTLKYSKQELESAFPPIENEKKSSIRGRKRENPIQICTTGFTDFDFSTVKKEYFGDKLSLSDMIYLIKNDIDMYEVLGLQDIYRDQTFNCIFHADRNPSAVIKNSFKGYRYFCNSSSCIMSGDNLGDSTNKGLDLIDLVMLIKNINFINAVKWIAKECGIILVMSNQKKFSPNEKSEEKYRDNSEIIDNILQKTLVDYPALQALLRRGTYGNGNNPGMILKVAAALNQEGLKNNKGYEINNNNVFYCSNRYIASLINRYSSYSDINKYLNLLSALNLIVKHEISELPNKKLAERSLAEAQKHKTGSDGKPYKVIMYYTIPHWTQKVLAGAEKRAERLLNVGFQTRFISEEYITSVLGEEIAKEVYGGYKRQKLSNTNREIIGAVQKRVLSSGFATMSGIKKSTWKKFVVPIMIKWEYQYVKIKILNRRFGFTTGAPRYVYQMGLINKVKPDRKIMTA